MGLRLIFAGLIFLFNPVKAIFDVLPDFIGWILIAAGMTRLRDLAPQLDQSMKHLTKLLILSGVQCGVMALLPLMSDTAYALVFTFVFTIAESVFTILFLNALTDGMTAVGIREGSDTPSAEIDNVRAMTVIFFIVKTVMTLLPELAYLSVTEYEGEITAVKRFDLADYPILLNSVNIVVTLILGLVWLNMILRWFGRIRKDTALVSAMERYYAAFAAENPGLLLRRKIKAATVLLGVFAVLQADILADGFCLTPDFIGALAVFPVILLLKESGSGWEKLKAPAVVFTVSGAAGFALSTVIAAKWYSVGITRSILGFYVFVAFLVVEAVSSASFVWLLFVLQRSLLAEIDLHTGEKLGDAFVHAAARQAEMQSDLRRQLRGVTVSGIVLAVVGLLRYALMYALPVLWIPAIAAAFVWGWLATGFLASFQKETERGIPNN